MKTLKKSFWVKALITQKWDNLKEVYSAISIKRHPAHAVLSLKRIYILLVFIIGATKLPAQNTPNYQHVADLSKIWKDVHENFCNPQLLKDINFDSIYQSFIPLVEKVNDKHEYQQFMANLRDGHTQLLFDNQKYAKQIDYLPVSFSWVSGRLYISDIEKKRSTEIPIGSEVLRIEGKDIKDYLEENIYPYISADTQQDKQWNALQLLYKGKKNDKISMQIKTPDGTDKETIFSFNARSTGLSPRDCIGWKDSPFSNYPRTDSYLVEQKGSKYFYFRFDKFANINITNLLQEASCRNDSVNAADYTILDLRNCRGGSELVADTLLMCFLNVDTLRTYKSLTKKNIAFYKAMGFGYSEYRDYYEGVKMDTLPEDILIKRELPLFYKPLYILISEQTYSAAEDFLITLKLHYPNRAILIGKPTGGSSGAPLVNKISDGTYYRICTRGALLPAGFMDNGITPDYYHEKTITDYLEGRDYVFDFIKNLYYNEIRLSL